MPSFTERSIGRKQIPTANYFLRNGATIVVPMLEHDATVQNRF